MLTARRGPGLAGLRLGSSGRGARPTRDAPQITRAHPARTRRGLLPPSSGDRLSSSHVAGRLGPTLPPVLRKGGAQRRAMRSVVPVLGLCLPMSLRLSCRLVCAGGHAGGWKVRCQ